MSLIIIILLILGFIGLALLIAGIIWGAVHEFKWYVWTLIGVGGLFVLIAIVGVLIEYAISRNKEEPVVIPDEPLPAQQQEQYRKQQEDKIARQKLAKDVKCFNDFHFNETDLNTIAKGCVAGTFQEAYDKLSVECPNLGTNICKNQVIKHLEDNLKPAVKPNLLQKQSSYPSTSNLTPPSPR